MYRNTPWSLYAKSDLLFLGGIKTISVDQQLPQGKNLCYDLAPFCSTQNWRINYEKIPGQQESCFEQINLKWRSDNRSQRKGAILYGNTRDKVLRHFKQIDFRIMLEKHGFCDRGGKG